MDIKSVLDERIICTELDAVDKEDALKKMIKMLLDAGYIDDAEGFYEDVLLRESQGITGIGNYIAIPHGKSSSVSKVGISIAKLNNEIHMETQGVIGIEDELDPKDIAEADVVILAVDVNVKGKERFAGKKMIEVPTETVVMSPNKLIEKIEQLV